MLGRHVLKTWSSTQPTVSLSSGEAEFYGVVRASGLALGQQSLMRDLGHEMPVRVWTDSSAAIGISSRQGLGKLRHIATRTLWIQQAICSKAIELRKVRGEVNPADLFTKHLSSRERVTNLTQLFGCEFREGRASIAPQLKKDGQGGVNTVGRRRNTHTDGHGHTHTHGHRHTTTTTTLHRNHTVRIGSHTSIPRRIGTRFSRRRRPSTTTSAKKRKSRTGSSTTGRRACTLSKAWRRLKETSSRRKEHQ